MADDILEKGYVSFHMLQKTMCLIYYRKDKPLGNALDQPFSWNEALDAVAETYNGVSYVHRSNIRS